MRRNILHPIEESILYSLRHTTEARYSQLMSPTNLASDDFKFHLRKLVEAQYILKTDRGTYELTDIGKEFANNLNKNARCNTEAAKDIATASRISNK